MTKVELVYCKGNINSHGFCEKCFHLSLTSSNICGRLVRVSSETYRLEKPVEGGIEGTEFGTPPEPKRAYCTEPDGCPWANCDCPIKDTQPFLTKEDACKAAAEAGYYLGHHNLWELGSFTEGFNIAAEKANARVAELEKERDELFAWKKYEMAIWGPVIDYCQNTKELGIQPGANISKWILELLEQYKLLIEQFKSSK